MNQDKHRELITRTRGVAELIQGRKTAMKLLAKEFGDDLLSILDHLEALESINADLLAACELTAAALFEYGIRDDGSGVLVPALVASRKAIAKAKETT